MKKIKIAMIGLRGIPAKSGGVEVVVENLAPLLVKQGMDVTVYCRSHYRKDRPEQWKGVKLRYIPTINSKATEALVHSFLATLDALFRRYDVIHYHAMGNGSFSILPRIFGKKTVVTLHGLDYQRDKWGRIAKTYLRLCQFLISFFPNRVISVSRKIKSLYLEKYNRDIHFIPNGVPLIPEKPIGRLKRFKLKKNKYFLFLSRIVPEKGVHYLIDAFHRVNTDMKLVIAGEATHTDEYLERIRKIAGENRNIVFTGPVYGEEKWEAYSNAYAFILPSTIEGMSIVLLEAMSCQLPCLVSDIKENLDVIEDCGFSFRARDVQNLKDKLEYLIHNREEAIQTGKKAYQLVRKNYQWERIGEQYSAIYRSI